MKPAPNEALDSAHCDVSTSHIGREVIVRTLQAPDRTYLQSYQAAERGNVSRGAVEQWLGICQEEPYIT